MTDEVKITGGSAFDGVYNVVPVEPEPFNVSEELKKAIEAVTNTIESRPFAARNPELGKMFKCQICGTRHRTNEKKCEQVFTYRIGDYELYRKNEEGELVPDYRTAIRPDEKPTKKQMMGQAAFTKKRFHPHPSKIKLLFIERTRKIFQELGFPLERGEKEEIKDFKETFEKNLQRSRILAAREIRAERESKDREVRRRADQSRRINRGLLAH